MGLDIDMRQYVPNMETIDFLELLNTASRSVYGQGQLADEIDYNELEDKWVLPGKLVYKIWASEGITGLHLTKPDYWLNFKQIADFIPQLEGTLGVTLLAYRDVSLSIVCGKVAGTSWLTGVCAHKPAPDPSIHYKEYAETDMLMMSMQALSAQPTWLTAPLFTVPVRKPGALGADYGAVQIVQSTFFLIPNRESTHTSVFVRFGYKEGDSERVRHVLVPVAMKLHLPSTGMKEFTDMVIEAAIYFADITDAYEKSVCPRCHRRLKSMADEVSPLLIVSGNMCLGCIAKTERTPLSPLSSDELFGTT